MRRTILVIAVVPMLVAVLAPARAIADQVYPSEHIPLTPVGDEPLRSGFVENIHASGPVVFAMERYVVNGASADTTYDVMLHIWIEDTSCTGEPDLVLPTVSFSTNAAGNGVGMVRFFARVPRCARDRTSCPEPFWRGRYVSKMADR